MRAARVEEGVDHKRWEETAQGSSCPSAILLVYKGRILTRVEGAVACSLCGYNVSKTRDSGRNSKDGDPYGRLRLPSAISMGKNAFAKTSDMVNFTYLCWKKLASRWSLFVARSNFHLY